MRIKKAIFLDIDGVLALEYGINRPKNEWILDTAYPFDKPCVNRLNTILEKTKAEIILTSQWRVDYTEDEIDTIFEWNGLIKTPIANTTYLGGFTRCMEIELFLEKHIVSNFVIIDDMELECFPKQFIKTNPKTGLTNNIAKRIINILK